MKLQPSVLVVSKTMTTKGKAITPFRNINKTAYNVSARRSYKRDDMSSCHLIQWTYTQFFCRGTL